jgi:hypothetical protein
VDLLKASKTVEQGGRSSFAKKTRKKKVTEKAGSEEE